MLAADLEREKQRLQVASWDENERKLRDELKLDLPPRQLSDDNIAYINRFARWAKDKGVRKCPCKPHTLACFIVEQHDLGVPPEQIIEIVKAVNDLHDYHQLSSPYTQVARAALAQAVKVTAPRGWNAADRGAFDALIDPLIKQAVSRHEYLRDRELRRKQNEISELKKRLLSTGDARAQTNQKVTENVTTP